MKLKLFLSALKKVYFVFLIPVFFITHEYLETISGIPFFDFLKLIGWNVLYVLILFLLLLLIIKSVNKTAVCCFFILIFNYPFGFLFDFLKSALGHTFLTRYSFLLPAILVILILLIFFLKKTDKNFIRPIKYLNVLFSLLLIIDVIQIAIISLKPEHSTTISSNLKTECDTCSKPDIYLILADEYAGAQELKQLFKLDNSKFEDSLKAKGFHIIKNTISNYNYTLYSMASMFSMQYLSPVKKLYQKKDIASCCAAINQNYFLSYLEKEGYKIKNLSVFRVNDSPSRMEDTFPFLGVNLLNRQTFFSRVLRDIGYHLVTTLKSKYFLAKAVNHYETDLRNNILARQLLLQEVQEIKTAPKFVYAHFVMPHDPFYFNSEGKRYPFTVSLPDTTILKKRYVEYLHYSNAQFLHLINGILKSAKSLPIIIFMSDHGSRLFDEPAEKKYQFATINAIYMPHKNYTQFYDGISNVNELRVLLNAVFNQSIPLLEDKSFYLQ